MARGRRALATLALPASLLGLAACTGAPDPASIRERTADLLAEDGIALLPAGVVATQRDAEDIEGCTTERVHRIRVDLDVDDDIDLLARMADRWEGQGEVTTFADQTLTLARDGYELVLSTTVGGLPGSTLQARSPCFEAP